MPDTGSKSGPLEHVIASPAWRLVIIVVSIGIAYGTLRADIGHTQERQDKLTSEQAEIIRVIQEFREAITEVRVSSATTQQQVKSLENLFEALNRKIDLLVWRTRQFGSDLEEERP